jgi:ATP-dependent Lon protease
VCAVAERIDGVPRPANILLNGPPGCGKTYFARKLAACFATEFHAIHLESIQTASEIVGDSDSYRSAAPGMLYNFLTNGKFGNPLILLDEICKMSGDSRFTPGSALLRLLEKETAKEFADNAENWCKLDMSMVFFVATSNTLDTISAPIRSRLKTFEIDMPKDPAAIILNIFDQAIDANYMAFAHMTLSTPALSALMSQSPRRIRQLIEDALGKALYEGRETVMACDVQVEPVKKSIGFQ